MASLLCESSYVPSDFLIGRTPFYKCHTYMAYILCECSYVCSDDLIGRMFADKYHIHMASRRCEFYGVFSIVVY
jgi:hypothetical protein